MKYSPLLIAWEVTRRCHLKCLHCRAWAEDHPYENELTLEEIKKTLTNISQFSKPIIILTGGEPMAREDIYEIGSFGSLLGLRMVMSPCGSLVDALAIKKMKEAGIKRISLSIDGARAGSHDAFRGLDGSFGDVLNAARVAREGDMPFQVNTTVTRLNIGELEEIVHLVLGLGAVSFHPFLLVPTGRGKDIAGLTLSPREYEDTLSWIDKMSRKTNIHVKPTCAPHFFRVQMESGGTIKKSGGHPHLDSVTRGCLGGIGFAFISHVGQVQICGFLDIRCGDIRESNYNFQEIWETSQVFLRMRDQKSYRGKCGICEYHNICGGCRARAYTVTGDYMNPEPYCVYIPKKVQNNDKNILTALQDEFPIHPKPFAMLAERFGITEQDLVGKITAWKNEGLVRHLSAHINTAALGFKGALVALAVEDGGVDDAAKVIASHPGVSHSYLRDHHYNIWFTIKVPNEFDLEDHILEISKLCGAKGCLSLPSIKTYKLDVRFDVSDLKNAGLSVSTKKTTVSLNLSPAGEEIIEALNRGLPTGERPFLNLAARLEISEEELCQRIALLKENGVIEKFRFVLNHQKIGIRANAMVVWDVGGERIDEAGEWFATKPFISHCYRRVRHDEFPYDIYTMIHGNNQEALDGLIQELARDIAPRAFLKLSTKRELTKTKAAIARREYERWVGCC